MSVSRYSRVAPLVQRALKQSNQHKLLCLPLATAQQNVDITRYASAVKYPWQNWGWKYLNSQKGRGRPISPHLTIYANDWSWTISGGHRIFGCILGVGATVFTAGLMVMPFDFTAIIEFLRGLGVPSPIWGVLKFIVAWMISFHTINGVRFLGMDMAKFTSINAIVGGGKLVLLSSLALAAFFGFVMPAMKCFSVALSSQHTGQVTAQTQYRPLIHAIRYGMSKYPPPSAVMVWNDGSGLQRVLRLLASNKLLLRQEAVRCVLQALTQQPALAPTVLVSCMDQLRSSSWSVRVCTADLLAQVMPLLLLHARHCLQPARDDGDCTIDIQQLLVEQPPLLACDSRELAQQQSIEAAGPASKHTQRQQLDKHLGLDPRVGVKSEDWIKEEELNGKGDSSSGSSTPSHSAQPSTSAQDRLRFAMQHLYALAKLQPTTTEDEDVKPDLSDVCASLVECLRALMWSSSWQCRHGALTAATQIILALKNSSQSHKLQPVAQGIVVDAVKVLCVDRFVDYTSGTGIAPVRETAAQLVSACVVLWPTLLLPVVTQHVRDMLSQRQTTHCTHAALTAIKYILPVVDEGVRANLLPLVVQVFAVDTKDAEHDDEMIATAATVLLSSQLSSDHARTVLQHASRWLTHATNTGVNDSVDSVLSLVSACCRLLAENQPQQRHLQQLTALLQVVQPYIAGGTSAAVRLCAARCAIQLAACQTPVPPLQLMKLFTLIVRQLIVESVDSAESVVSALVVCVHDLAAGCSRAQLQAALQHCIVGWLAVNMLPCHQPQAESCALLLDVSRATESASGVVFMLDATSAVPVYDLCICGPELRAAEPDQQLLAVTERKVWLARALAPLVDACADSLVDSLVFHLGQPSANQQFAVLLQLAHSACIDQTLIKAVHEASARLADCVFDETALYMASVNKQCAQFIANCNALNVSTPTGPVRSVEQALAVCQQAYNAARHRTAELDSSWERLRTEISSVGPDVSRHKRRIGGVLSCVLIGANALPPKLNPVIRPLIDCIQHEHVRALVTLAADNMARLFNELIERLPNVCNKLFGNVCVLLCANDCAGPLAQQTPSTSAALGPVPEPSQLRANAGCVLQRIVRRLDTAGCTKLTALTDLLQWQDTDLQDVSAVHQRLCVCACVFHSLPEAQQLQYLVDGTPYLCRVLLQPANAHIGFITAKLLADLCVAHATVVLNGVLPTAMHCLQQYDQPDSAVQAVLEFIYVLQQRSSSAQLSLSGLLACLCLRHTSHRSSTVRSLATQTFNHMVQVLPLNISSGVQPKTEIDHNADSTGLLSQLSPSIQQAARDNRSLLTLLNSPADLPTVDLSSIGLGAVQLRDYQREGITWLCFLHKYNLHGLLADDMGLGKTLQTLCVMAYSHTQQQQQQQQQRRSLVICPKTLVPHWVNEAAKYFGTSPTSRLRAVEWTPVAVQSGQHQLYVASYDTVRRESAAFAGVGWHYCVLDEGHVLRNANTKLYAAVSALSTQHRLILTGTPVQNTVLDLWALFDWLMPGYLGSYAHFSQAYVRPISQTLNDANQDKTDIATKALQLLHKQVLPFALRRLKSEVLKELPPKIVQDVYCELTDAQRAVYTQTLQSVARKSLSPLAALHCLRRIVDHPSLLQTDAHAFDEASLSESGKLCALQQILIDSGIAVGDGAAETGNGAVDEEQLELQRGESQHRALIFCQFKSCLQLLANFIDAGAFGAGLNYLRLDGTIPAAQRQSVADRFNADSSIQLLLLTTQVGGLGLTLTGADIVIFVDHDWNPTRDLQAVDRAHRLGQTRSVNVYRLITRGTVEEKILGLQKWKTDTAQALIGEDNTSLKSMATSQLLELFSLSDQPVDPTSAAPPAAKRQKTQPTPDADESADLAELWESSADYEQQFDVAKFAASVAK